MKRSEIISNRKSRGWTQAELAERVGISREYLGQIERGAADLSRTVECALRWVLRDEADPVRDALTNLLDVSGWRPCR
jgi:transcriptional regulator with XRE-family HTH domain